MDLGLFVKSGMAGAIFSALVLIVTKLAEKFRPKHIIKAEVNADYERQIRFLNEQVERLNKDVQELRDELRANSRREHQLHLAIHRHCRESPQCAQWFDGELTRIEGHAST